MIGSATQYGSLVVIRDQYGSQTGSFPLNGGELLGYSGSFLVIQYGGQIATVDEHGSRLGFTPMPNTHRVMGINESGFSARTGSVVEVYDKYCNHVDHYSV